MYNKNIKYKKAIIHQCVDGIEKDTEVYLPDLEAPKGRDEMSPTARRAIDLMNELHPTALEMCNWSGLTDRIFEEIAQKTGEKYAEVQSAMRTQLPKDQSWQERADALQRISLEADRQSFELMHQLVEVTSQAALHAMSLKELEQWQLP